MTSTITITLPKFWLLMAPCGCADGSMVSVRIDGTICAGSAEDAWKKFTPNKRSRDKEARAGWVCRGITDEEQGRFKEMMTTTCTHEAAL
ncbi:MAG: hypothetical protein H7288_11560 [Kineosporiaceae bacterium]|nr:hypothetical protein [Aeromicrobium sp.]